VGRCSRCDHAREIPRHDGIGIGAADATLWSFPERVNATGPHVTDATTDAQLSKTALGLLRLPAIPRCLQSLLLGTLEHLLCRTIYAALFHGSSFFEFGTNVLISFSLSFIDIPILSYQILLERLAS
jgi:hypothetical protein